MRLLELNLRNQKDAKADAHRLASHAVIAFYMGFAPVLLSLKYNEFRFAKSIYGTLGGSHDRDSEATAYLAGAIAVSILKGEKKIKDDVQGRVCSILSGDPIGVDDTSSPLNTARFERVYQRTVELVRHPSEWGKIVDLSKRLMKEGELTEKNILAVIRTAKAKVPDRLSVYDW